MKRNLVTASLALGMLLMASPAAALAKLYGAAHNGPNGLATLYEIDHTNGNATPIGTGIGFERVSGMDFHPVTGVLYATGERTDGSNVPVLLTIDTTTGLGSEIAALNGGLPHSFGGLFDSKNGSAYTDLSFRNSDNALFTYLEGKDGVGRIDITNGNLNELGGSGVECCGNGIAFDAADTLYHGNDVAFHTLNQVTGVASFVSSLTPPPGRTFPRVNALEVDPDNGVVYASFNSESGRELATVDLGSGVVTPLGTTVAGLGALAAAPMPEPGSLTLFGVGAVAVRCGMRRRRGR